MHTMAAYLAASVSLGDITGGLPGRVWDSTDSVKLMSVDALVT